MVSKSIQEEITTIKLKKSTRNELAKLGSKIETFDDLVLRLIKEAKGK